MIKYNHGKGGYMKPISNEKREMLISAKQRGEKETDIAKWLNISKGSVCVTGNVYTHSTIDGLKRALDGFKF